MSDASRSLTVSQAELADSADVDEKMAAALNEVGRADSLTHSTLSLVVHQSFDRAVEQIESYIRMKEDFPQFKFMSARHADHAKDLIHAIKTKRTMPGLEALSMAKRQEIYDRVLNHFNDLKSTLKQIETMEYNVRVADLRSTVIVIKTICWCVFAVLVLGFCLEVYHGLYSTTGSVMEDMINDAVDWVFSAVGL